MAVTVLSEPMRLQLQRKYLIGDFSGTAAWATIRQLFLGGWIEDRRDGNGEVPTEKGRRYCERASQAAHASEMEQTFSEMEALAESGVAVPALFIMSSGSRPKILESHLYCSGACMEAACRHFDADSLGDGIGEAKAGMVCEECGSPLLGP